ncbi:MAG TPA: hypothetical protein VG962_11145 [Steroidobacteraceae bacterium]|nr:hypothetical protein [Steroidobacteraceae bacterium]
MVKSISNSLFIFTAILMMSLLTGCAAPMDYMVQPVAMINRTMVSDSTVGEVTVLELYSMNAMNNRHVRAELTGTGQHSEKRIFHVTGQREEFHGFLRGEAFWILPPFGSLFMHEGNYFLIQYTDRKVYGLALEKSGVTYYKERADGELKPVAVEAMPFSVAILSNAPLTVEIRATGTQGGS